MPGIYKTTGHQSRSAVTPEVLSGGQDNIAKNITLPSLSSAGEDAISSPVLTANASSSLNDGSVASVPSAPFPGGEEAPSSVLPASETRETLPISRLIRQAWNPVDDSNREGSEALSVYDPDRDNADGVFLWHRPGSSDASPSDEGRTRAAAKTKMAGNNTDSLFSFIDDALLEEAREFRRKRYNRQVPEVDPGLVTQLREAVAAAKSRTLVRSTVEGQLGSLWMMEQKDEIARFTARLSGDTMRDWIRDTLPGTSRGEAGETSPGNRSAAWSLVRRLESTLKTLIRVVDILSVMHACGTPENRRDMLVAELTQAFSSSDEDTVIQALGRMTAEAEGHAAWSSLMDARTAAWEASQVATFGAMSRIARHEAEKACKKARQLQGDAQIFFNAIDLYFCKLSNDFRRASVNVSQSSSPLIMQEVNDKELAVSSSHSDSLLDKLETGFVKNKLKAEIAIAVWKKYIHQFNRVRVHGHPSETLSKTSAQVTDDSVIRSILWQWQQPAISIQYASGALLSKVDELQEIEGMFSSCVVEQDRGREQEDSYVPVSHPGGDDRVAQVRQWVNERTEQAKPETLQVEKLAVLGKLLDGDIDNARALTGRLREKAENIENVLRKQRFAVLNMVMQRSGLAPSLKAVDKLLPKIAGDLDAAIVALDKACQAATTRDFAEAKKRASTAQLLATKVKEKLSTESARLTERPLDEHSRGSRLAKHWANLSREQSRNNDVSPDAAQVLSFLKKRGGLAEVLSVGDPEGYLFATRLAGELENARHDELRLPMSTEQYAALEKGLVEYIVKWGQKRLSRGGTRLIIKLAFEHGLDTVSFSLSNLLRLPYKVVKASIKVPYSVHKISRYTMPGQDKPYKAIYSLLGKKLKQLGFNLMTAPLPGVVKLAAGAAVTAGAAAYNLYVGRKENTFSAVYERVAEGKKSKKIKMDSLAGMLLDSGIDVATTAAFKGTRLAWTSGKNKFGGALNKPIVNHYPDDLDEETLSQAQWGQVETENDNTTGVNAAANGRDVGAVSLASPLPQQAGVKPFGYSREPTSGLPPIRRKRAVEKEPAPEVTKKGADAIPDKVTLESEHHDFDRGIFYKDFSSKQKVQTYRHAIKYVLLKIENDERLSDNIRNRAYMARIGADYLMPVDIKESKLINTIFLPDNLDSKSGVLIRLDSENPYYIVNSGKDIPEDLKQDLPYSSYTKTLDWSYPFISRNTFQRFDSLRNGEMRYFNATSRSMTISKLSEYLANTIEADYKLKKKTIKNKLLITRAITGAHIPDDEVTATSALYHVEFTWGGSTQADYLRAFSRPFTILSRDIQLIISSTNGETIEEADVHAHQAEYIGSWVDATVGAVTSFTPEGLVLNSLQSAADISADLTEGKDPDPLAVAGLIMMYLPGDKIATKIAKFTRIGGTGVKYGIMLGNKVVDLVNVGKSIKAAVDTGDPLAIYQAFLLSGMSVQNSYSMAKNISSALKLNRIEDSVSLEELEALQNNASGYSVSPEMPVRTFKVGQTQLHGKINKGEMEISRDGGATWERGSELHRLAYRLQNAGGGRKLLGEDEPSSQERSQLSESPGNTQKEEASTSQERSQTVESPDNAQKAGYSDSSGRSIGPTTEYKIQINKSTRAALRKKIKGTRIKYFDPRSSKFKNSNDFTVVHTGVETEKVKTGISVETLTASLNKMQSKTNELIRQLKYYNGDDKDAILKDMENINSVTDKIKINLTQTDNVSDANIYILVEKKSNPEDINNHYGLAELQFSADKKDLSLNHLIPHPDVVVNKYPEFRDYLISRSDISMKELEKYNIKNVERYLGSKALESEISYYDLPSKTVKTVLLTMPEAFGHELFSSSLSDKEPENAFTFVHAGVTTGMSVDTLIASLNKMESKVASLISKLENYRGVDKDAISKDMKNINSMINKVRKDLTQADNASDANIYMLVKKNSNAENINNHFGLAKLQFLADKKDLSLNEIIAHPDVVVNQYPEFRDYLTANGYIDVDKLEKFNINNIFYTKEVKIETQRVQNVKGEGELPSTSQARPQSNEDTENAQKIVLEPNLSSASERESVELRESDRLMPTDKQLKQNDKIYNRLKNIEASAKLVHKNLSMGKGEIVIRAGFNVVSSIAVGGVNFTAGILIPAIEAFPVALGGITGTFTGDAINTILQKLVGSDLTHTLDMDTRLPWGTNQNRDLFIKTIKPRIKDYLFAIGTAHSYPLAVSETNDAHSTHNSIAKNISDASNLIYYQGQLAQKAYHETKVLLKEIDLLEAMAYSNLGISPDEAHTTPGTMMTRSSARFYGKERDIAAFAYKLRSARNAVMKLNDHSLRLGYPAGWILRHTKSIPERAHPASVPALERTPPASVPAPERTPPAVPATKSIPNRTHRPDVLAARKAKARREFFATWEEKFASGSS